MMKFIKILIALFVGQHVNDADSDYAFKGLMWFALFAIAAMMILGRLLD